jgi:hypothetical protein
VRRTGPGGARRERSSPLTFRRFGRAINTDEVFGTHRLTGRLVPDHKTIADFRKDNGRAIRQVCARFVVLCRTMGLFTEAIVAIDGSKFKAVNNRDKNFTRAKMERGFSSKFKTGKLGCPHCLWGTFSNHDPLSPASAGLSFWWGGRDSFLPSL